MKFLTHYEKKLIVRMWRDRCTQAAIAATVGTTQGAISKILARARRMDPTLPKRSRERRAAMPPARPRLIVASQMNGQLDYL